MPAARAFDPGPRRPSAPFTDDPARLLSWVNTAMVERAGTGDEFVTAACITYLPGERHLRWAYAGHPPALWLDDGRELIAPRQGTPLGVRADPEATEYSLRLMAGTGVLLYTDGLTEARGDDRRLGLNDVRAALAGLSLPSPAEAVRSDAKSATRARTASTQTRQSPVLSDGDAGLRAMQRAAAHGVLGFVSASQPSRRGRGGRYRLTGL